MPRTASSPPVSLRGKIVTPNSVTLVLQEGGVDRVEAIPSNDPRFDKVLEWLKRKSTDLKGLLKALAPVVLAKVVPELRDTAIAAALTGQSSKALERFNARLLKNPSKSAKASLYRYVAEEGVTMTEDGCLVMYKRVDTHLKAFHDGSFQYKVGAWAKVDRARCGDHPSTPCGFGLHVCPWKHLSQWFSNRHDCNLLELVCPPEDFTSVPERQAKLLTCNLFVRRIMNPGDIPLQPLVETKAVRKRAQGKGKDLKVSGSSSRGRLAVPVQVLQEAGWQGGSRKSPDLRIVVTDPRSRFFFLTSLDNSSLRGEEFLKRDTPFYERAVSVDPDRLDVPLTKGDLAVCQINAPLSFKVLSPGVIQARPTK